MVCDAGFALQHDMELRDYQKLAIEKIRWALDKKLEGNNLIVLPTGSGKSIVIAHLVQQLREPVLILQPTKEILEQNLEKLLRYVDRSEIGIFSASMNDKTVGTYTFATIQSIYKKPELFARFRLVILDEAHLLNPKNLSGMFTSFLRKIGNPKVVGLTATPYRLDTMYVTRDDGDLEIVTTTRLINRTKQFFWQRVLLNVTIADLIERGYLCPLEYVDRSIVRQEDLKLNKSRSDFDLDAYEEITSERQHEMLNAIAYGMERAKSVLVFCSSVAQARRFAGIINGAKSVSAMTPAKERDRIVSAFKTGEIKVVCNVGVLTTGFDHPALDCVVLLRPTRSIALYSQMIGRGVRTAEGKTSCLVVDCTSTVQNLGRIETIKMVKREKWELESETGSWHNTELFRFTVHRGTQKAML